MIFFFDLDNQEFTKDKLRRRLYNSKVMMGEVVKRAFNSERCLGFENHVEALKQKMDDILHVRNKLTQRGLKEIIKKGNFSTKTVNELIKNDDSFYKVIEWAYSKARFVEKEENLSLRANVISDSEISIAPVQNVINGTIKDDKDCWLSDYSSSIHWMVVDLKRQFDLEYIIIKHHPFNQRLITYDFDVLISNDNVNWKVMKTYSKNEDKINVIKMNSCARYIKLFIRQANKINENSVRLFGLDVYAKK